MIQRLAFTLLTIAISLRVAAEENPTILPFEPAQLLAALPTAPAEWKTLRSEADSVLGEWLETRATRTFQAPPEPVSPSEAKTEEIKPGEVEITIVDTAGFTPSLAAFAGFTPAKNGNVEKKFLGTLPAIFVINGNGSRFVQVLVSMRYLVEVTLTHLPRQRMEDWLQAFRLQALPTANRSQTTRPREFRLTHIDELRPQNNRSYAVSTTSAQRLDAFLKTLPSAPAEE